MSLIITDNIWVSSDEHRPLVTKKVLAYYRTLYKRISIGIASNFSSLYSGCCCRHTLYPKSSVTTPTGWKDAVTRDQSWWNHASIVGQCPRMNDNIIPLVYRCNSYAPAECIERGMTIISLRFSRRWRRLLSLVFRGAVDIKSAELVHLGRKWLLHDWLLIYS